MLSNSGTNRAFLDRWRRANTPNER